MQQGTETNLSAGIKKKTRLDEDKSRNILTWKFKTY